MKFILKFTEAADSIIIFWTFGPHCIHSTCTVKKAIQNVAPWFRACVAIKSITDVLLNSPVNFAKIFNHCNTEFIRESCIKQQSTGEKQKTGP